MVDTKLIKIGEILVEQMMLIKDLGVSKNRGTPNWMVYNGKPY